MARAQLCPVETKLFPGDQTIKLFLFFPSAFQSPTHKTPAAFRCRGEVPNSQFNWKLHKNISQKQMLSFRVLILCASYPPLYVSHFYKRNSSFKTVIPKPIRDTPAPTSNFWYYICLSWSANRLKFHLYQAFEAFLYFTGFHKWYNIFLYFILKSSWVPSQSPANPEPSGQGLL